MKLNKSIILFFGSRVKFMGCHIEGFKVGPLIW